MEKHKDELLRQIEIYKKNAIEHITKESMIEAMWDVSILIDLKAQLGIIEKNKEKETEKASQEYVDM